MKTIQTFFEGNIYGIEKIQIAIFFIAIFIIYLLWLSRPNKDHFTQTDILSTLSSSSMTPSSINLIPTTMNDSMVPTIIGSGILPITMIPTITNLSTTPSVLNAANLTPITNSSAPINNNNASNIDLMAVNNIMKPMIDTANYSAPMSNSYFAPVSNNNSVPMSNSYSVPVSNNNSAPMSNSFSAPVSNNNSAPMSNSFSAPMSNSYSAPMSNSYSDPMSNNISSSNTISTNNVDLMAVNNIMKPMIDTNIISNSENNYDNSQSSNIGSSINNMSSKPYEL
jgi:hypothetical protein